MKHIVVSSVIVGLLSQPVCAIAGEFYEHPLLAQYCAEIREHSETSIVDPTQLPAEAEYVQPRPSEILGQRVESASRRFALEGTLLMGLVVTADGQAKDLRVLESSGSGRLDQEAQSLMHGAIFSARLNEEPVAACTVLRITFKVSGAPG